MAAFISREAIIRFFYSSQRLSDFFSEDCQIAFYKLKQHFVFNIQSNMSKLQPYLGRSNDVCFKQVSAEYRLNILQSVYFETKSLAVEWRNVD